METYKMRNKLIMSYYKINMDVYQNIARRQYIGYFNNK